MDTKRLRELNIADQTEQELVCAILLIYTGDKRSAKTISQHIAEKLTQRRTIIRKRRDGAAGGMSDKLEFEVAGHPEEILRFNPGPTECGNITDGVAFYHGNRGAWIVSFADLERMYLAAKLARRGQ